MQYVEALLLLRLETYKHINRNNDKSKYTGKVDVSLFCFQNHAQYHAQYHAHPYISLCAVGPLAITEENGVQWLFIAVADNAIMQAHLCIQNQLFLM